MISGSGGVTVIDSRVFSASVDSALVDLVRFSGSSGAGAADTFLGSAVDVGTRTGEKSDGRTAAGRKSGRKKGLDIPGRKMELGDDGRIDVDDAGAPVDPDGDIFDSSRSNC